MSPACDSAACQVDPGFALLAVEPAVTVPLRHAILRPDLPLDACVNDYDHAEGALHLAAFEGRDDLIVGVGSILPDPLLDPPAAGQPIHWVIHAMAVHPHYRRAGVGAALLTSLIDYVWQCSAPLASIRLDSVPSAIGFYRRHGFVAAGSREYGGPLPMRLSAAATNRRSFLRSR